MNTYQLWSVSPSGRPDQFLFEGTRIECVDEMAQWIEDNPESEYRIVKAESIYEDDNNFLHFI